MFNPGDQVVAKIRISKYGRRSCGYACTVIRQTKPDRVMVVTNQAFGVDGGCLKVAEVSTGLVERVPWQRISPEALVWLRKFYSNNHAGVLDKLHGIKDQ